MMIPLQDDELIPDADLAAEWNVTRRTLGRYDLERNGLPFVLVGNRKFRPKRACRKWLAARIKHPNPRRAAA